MHTLIRAMQFSAIPTELVEHIFANVTPEVRPGLDLAHLALVNHGFHKLIYESTDKHVWRMVFLSVFDHPRHALPHIATEFPGRSGTDEPEYLYDWRAALMRRMRAAGVMRRFLAPETTIREREEALETLVDIVLTAVPFSDAFPESRNTIFAETLLDDHPIPELPDWRPTTPEELTLKAWLRAFGPRMPAHADPHNKSMERLLARAYVYDMRNYTRKTLWGPYTPSKHVSWLHVDAIAQVVLHNVKEHHLDEEDSMPPLGFHNVRRFSAKDYHKRRDEDWAGVEGVWTRVVCFMDYRDLMSYNFSAEGNAPLDVSLLQSDEFGEATRIIKVEMRLDRVSENADNPAYPRLHIKGRSFQVDGVETYGPMKGTVYMTKEGVVRWQFFDHQISNVGQNPQWGSEGIQIGGVGSAIGVLGIWTGVNHEDGDPAGPWWLWKDSGPDTRMSPRGLANLGI
ncbi:hypothetical protein AURDEDRAFT_179023 [Auricularia subglabra TFB-10046 SS5]|nr:hypothetical protein AURDEDRAFT_179023 [Auricularia subglabra TFB-10046 SS5]